MAGYYIPLVGTPQIGDSGGGGSGLPAVTAADNGDVLTVVNGAWDKAAPSGGGVLAVHDVDGTLDKTWQEIADAVATTGAAIVYGTGEHVVGAATVISCIENLLSGTFFVNIVNGVTGNSVTYEASTATGYPQFDSN